MSKLTMQELYDGLQGKGFVRYVDAMARALRFELENYDELCWYPLDEDELDILMDAMGWSAYDLLYHCDNPKFNLSDDYFRFDVYEGNIESISYNGLADLYEELLFDENYLELVETILESISL